MLIIRYTKTDGAEYISHLDTLRHLCRTLRRAKIEVKLSEGFNKHMRLFMSAPIGVGIRSLAEYCVIETDYSNEQEFVSLFNANSPTGIKCVWAKNIDKNPNVAGCITACEYRIEGMTTFNVNEILSREELIITDKRARTINVRDRILSMRFEGSDLICTLSAGNVNLRADVLADALTALYGGRTGQITKLNAFGLNFD